jgi:chemotaxis protein CheD
MSALQADIRQSADKAQQILPTLTGFENINRYWDREHLTVAAKILPGQYYVTIRDEVIVTVLGSCISACIRDRVTGIGGMNHFMLPDTQMNPEDQISGLSTRYGSNAMECMINDILRNGGRRANLEVKIFGGGRILANMTDIGYRNIVFVNKYVQNESLKVTGMDVGDVYPRKVMYYPVSGRVMVKKLKSIHNNTIVEREQAYVSTIKDIAKNQVELF